MALPRRMAAAQTRFLLLAAEILIRLLATKNCRKLLLLAIFGRLITRVRYAKMSHYWFRFGTPDSQTKIWQKCENLLRLSRHFSGSVPDVVVSRNIPPT